MPSAASAATKVIFLTSGSSWTVPSDWNSSSNTIECIGAGGTGGINNGGAGGAYAKRSNVVLNPGGSISYSVGTASTTPLSAGSDTWFSSTAILECAGGGSGGSSHGDVTNAGGAGGAGGSTHNGPGGGGAAGPHGAGASGGSTTGSTGPVAGAGGAGDNGDAAGGAGGGNFTNYGTNPQGGPGSSEALWTQTSNGAVAGPGGGGGGSGSGFPNAGVMGGAAGLYGGGSGAPGRGSPDVSTNAAGGQGIIVITYTPTSGGGGGGGSGVAGTTNYSYDAQGRLTCAATPDGYYTSYILDVADNRTQVTRNTAGCVSGGQAPTAANSSPSVPENSVNYPIQLSLSGGAPTSLTIVTNANPGNAVVSGTSILYTPAANSTASDSFQYTASNAYGTSSVATVSITVTPTLQAPIANSVTGLTFYLGTSNNAVPLHLTGGAATRVTVSTQASHGTATASGTTITYTPTSAGSDSFQYTATNAAGTSAPATVSFSNNYADGTVLYTVTPAYVANTSPVTSAYSYTVPAGVSYVDIEIWGAGAGGSIFEQCVYAACSTAYYGGGGAGYVKKHIAVTAGTVISGNVGIGGTGDAISAFTIYNGIGYTGYYWGVAGGNTTVSSPALTATGGASDYTGGAGGTGSGGDTNTSGTAVSGQTGGGAGDGGGGQSTINATGTAPGGGGGSGGAGASGEVKITARTS